MNKKLCLPAVGVFSLSFLAILLTLHFKAEGESCFDAAISGSVFSGGFGGVLLPGIVFPIIFIINQIVCIFKNKCGFCHIWGILSLAGGVMLIVIPMKIQTFRYEIIFEILYFVSCLLLIIQDLLLKYNGKK